MTDERVPARTLRWRWTWAACLGTLVACGEQPAPTESSAPVTARPGVSFSWYRIDPPSRCVPGDYFEGMAFGINAGGLTVGSFRDTSCNPDRSVEMPFLWRPTTWSTEILPVPPGFRGGVALAINEAGAIAGYGIDGIGAHQALYWPTSRSVIRLGPLLPAGSSEARGIDGTGTVVGLTNGSGWPVGFHRPTLPDYTFAAGGRAFSWNAATGVRLLKGLGGTWEHANRVSPDGMIVGAAADPRGVVHPVAWIDSFPTDLKFPQGISARFGETLGAGGATASAVGAAFDSGQAQPVGFITKLRSIHPVALAWPGSPLTVAHDVNTQGQTVGWFLDPAWGLQPSPFWYQSGVGFQAMLPSQTVGQAVDINECGAVAGWTLNGLQQSVAIVWDNGCLPRAVLRAPTGP